jgi:hypothetical protein
MDWRAAQSKIEASVKIGTDLNTPNSTYRVVKSVDSVINSKRYGYCNERGFVVPIGKRNTVSIPWSMLHTCFVQMNRVGWYDGGFFESQFPIQAQDHPCHVHVVGQIFAAAGIVRVEGRQYQRIEEKTD